MTRAWMAMLLIGTAAAGCHRDPPTSGMQLAPPAGTKLVDRPFPSWPPSQQAGYVALGVSEAKAELPELAEGRWVAPLHNANDSPFVVEASLCAEDPEAQAVSDRLMATFAAAGWSAGTIAGVAADVVPVARRFGKSAFVVTSYVAKGHWDGCPDPAHQSYVTLVVGKRQL